MTAISYSTGRTGQHGELRQFQEHGHHVTPDARHPLAAADMHIPLPMQFVEAKLSWVLTNLWLRLRGVMPVVLVDALGHSRLFSFDGEIPY